MQVVENMLYLDWEKKEKKRDIHFSTFIPNIWFGLGDLSDLLGHDN